MKTICVWNPKEVERASKLPKVILPPNFNPSIYKHMLLVQRVTWSLSGTLNLGEMTAFDTIEEIHKATGICLCYSVIWEEEE